MPKILIVEDDPQISKSLKINLKLAGFETQDASTIADAWSLLTEGKFDLICLDIGLPDGSGLDLCQKIRENGDDIPILFISARTDEATVVRGIQQGGDDYLRKPFGIEELKVRIQKILKRLAPPAPVISFGSLSIDSSRRIATIMGQIVNLGRKELDILIMLTRKSGEIVSRESIMAKVYECSDLYDRTIDSHMSHLRRKLRAVAGGSLQINSVYGLGYRLECK